MGKGIRLIIKLWVIFLRQVSDRFAVLKLLTSPQAYVAAVALSDVEEGFAVVEKWLTALWAPKLVSSLRCSDLRTIYSAA